MVAIKVEARCKVCSHPERAAIDELLFLRSQRAKAEDGTPITLAFVLERMEQMGVVNPTEENIKVHWRRHCEVRSLTVQQAEAEAALGLLAGITDEQLMTMSRQDLVDLLMRQGIAEARARASTGGKAGITIDHVLRLADLQIKEKGNESQQAFLQSLGGGIKAALEAAHPRALPAGDVIEAVVVEEEEVLGEQPSS